MSTINKKVFNKKMSDNGNSLTWVAGKIGYDRSYIHIVRKMQTKLSKKMEKRLIALYGEEVIRE